MSPWIFIQINNLFKLPALGIKPHLPLNHKTSYLSLHQGESLAQFLFTNNYLIFYPSLRNLTNHIAITLAQKQKSGVSHGGSPKFWGGLISPYGVVMDVPLIITTTSHHHATRQFLQVTQQWPEIFYEIANLLSYFHAQLRWDFKKNRLSKKWAWA